MTDYTSFADPGDFCRVCRGTGTLRHETERETFLAEDCYMCGGHGKRTIRVTERADA